MTVLSEISNVIRNAWRRRVGFYDERRFYAYSGKQEHPLDIDGRCHHVTSRACICQDPLAPHSVMPPEDPPEDPLAPHFVMPPADWKDIQWREGICFGQIAADRSCSDQADHQPGVLYTHPNRHQP